MPLDLTGFVTPPSSDRPPEGTSREAVRARAAWMQQREAELYTETPPRADEVGPGNLAQYRAAQTAQPAGGLNLTGFVTPPDSRSWFARGVDALSAPLIPQIQSGADALANVIDPRSLNESPLEARIRGAVAGAVQGAGGVVGGFASPLGLAAGLSGLGAEKSGAAGLVTLARTLRAAEAATGAAFAERGLEQAATAPDLAGKALGVAQAAGGALGVHGGLTGGVRPRAIVPEVITPEAEAVRPVRGALPPGPRFVVDPMGRVVPVEQAGALDLSAFVAPTSPVKAGPDTSFVRGVPAAPLEYTAEGRRIVPSVYSSDVNAAPAPKVDLSDPALVHALKWIQADMENVPFSPKNFNEIPTRHGGSLEVTGGAAGAPIYRAIVGPEGREISGAGRGDVLAAINNLLDGKLTPVGDLVLGVAKDLAAGDRSVVGEMMLPPDAGGDLRGTIWDRPPAAPEPAADVLPTGELQPQLPEAGAVRAQNIQTPAVADAPFSLTSEAAAVPAAQASFSDLLDAGQRARTATEPEPQSFPANPEGGPGRGALRAARERAAATGRDYFIERAKGGLIDVVSDRPPTGQAMRVTPSGDFFPVEQAARRALSPGQEAGIQSLDDFLTSLHGEDAPLKGNGTFRPAPVAREPGEEGRIDPVLAARVGLGTAGAAYGAATGTTPEDRIKRALLFGGAGALAPSLLSRGGAGPLGALTREQGRQVAEQQTAATAGESRRMFTPKAGAMPESAIASAHPMSEEQKLGASWLKSYTPEVRKPIADTFAEYNGFEEQRRGVQPDRRVEQLAQRIAVDMAQARPGSIANVEESRAMANATATLFDRMKAARADLDQAHAKGDPSAVDAVQMELAKLYQDGAVMLGNVRANASEQGRALRGQQLINQALRSYDERIIGEAVKKLSPDQLKLFTEQLSKLPNDPQAFYQLLQQHLQAQRGPSSLFFAYLYNNVLSGPSTFIKNVLGTGQNALFQAGANVVAGVMEARKPMADRAVLLSEPAAAGTAAVDGLFRGGKAALFILRHGYDPLAVERGEIPNVFTELPGGAATNWPTRLTRAIHGVFYQEAARSFEATSIAYTQAAKEIAQAQPALTGTALADAIGKRTVELAATPDIQAQAAQVAARTTFTEDMGPTGRAFGNLLNSNKALRLMQLFYKIPYNITKQQLRSNTLLAFIPQLGEPDIYAGGRAGAQAQARAVLGTAILAPLTAMVVAGRITGNGPTDPKQRSLWLQTHQPNSIRVGDSWVDYRALPVATPLAMIANIHEAYLDGLIKDGDVSQALSAVVARLGNVVTAQPFLAGIKNFIDAAEAPAGRAAALLKSSVQMLVPASGLMRGVTRAEDPTIRRVESPADAVKEITQGLSQTLQPRVDIFGKPIDRPGNALQRGFLPPEANPVPIKRDPIVSMLEELHIAPGIPGGQVKRRGVPLPLTPDQQTAVREAIGQMRRTGLERLIASPSWEGLSEKAKTRLVKETLSHASEHVEARVKGRFGAQMPITVQGLMPPAAAQQEATQ